MSTRKKGRRRRKAFSPWRHFLQNAILYYLHCVHYIGEGFVGQLDIWQEILGCYWQHLAANVSERVHITHVICVKLKMELDITS